MAPLVVLVAGLGSGPACPARAPDLPWAGTWKVTILQGAGGEITPWLVQLSGTDRLTGKVVASLKSYKDTSVKEAKADARGLRFTLAQDANLFIVVAPAPPSKEKAPARLPGTLRVQTSIFPVLLEKTKLKDLDEKSAHKPLEGARDLLAATRLKDPEEQGKAVKGILSKNAGKPIALFAAQLLLLNQAAQKVGPEVLQAAADRYVKEASVYGPALASNANAEVAQGLARNPRTLALALGYARAAVKLQPDDDPPERRRGLLRLLAAVLRQAGKKDEASSLRPRLDRLDAELDAAYRKRVPPLKPEKFVGRKGKSERVVVVELFTNAQARGCVAADLAFDAVLATYTSREAVFLQYHLHLPGPDPLHTPASEARAKYYGAAIEGTPMAFRDGRATTAILGEDGYLSGAAPRARASYDTLRKLIDKELEAPAGARLEMTVERKGDRIDIRTAVSGVKEPGEKVRLRFFLLEDVARYRGGNGQWLHRHVVCALPGGAAGFAVDGKSVKHTASITLAGVRKELTRHAEKMGAEPLLELRKLKVVALVQDDRTKKVLQAAGADVPAAPAGGAEEKE
jgi:hypothetical protein